MTVQVSGGPSLDGGRTVTEDVGFFASFFRSLLDPASPSSSSGSAWRSSWPVLHLPAGSWDARRPDVRRLAGRARMLPVRSSVWSCSSPRSCSSCCSCIRASACRRSRASVPGARRALPVRHVGAWRRGLAVRDPRSRSSPPSSDRGPRRMRLRHRGSTGTRSSWARCRAGRPQRWSGRLGELDGGIRPRHPHRGRPRRVVEMEGLKLQVEPTEVRQRRVGVVLLLILMSLAIKIVRGTNG